MRRTRDLSKREFERILIIKPSSLGDVVHALPVLNGLRKRYPDSRIDWLIASPFAPLLKGHPDINDLIEFDRARFARVGRSFAVTKEFISFLRSLRDKSYHLVLDLQGLFRSAFIARATGAPTRIGFKNAREGARFFYTDHIQPPEIKAIPDAHDDANPHAQVDANAHAHTHPDAHAVDLCYAVSTMLGFADTPIEFNLAIDKSDRDAASNALAAAGMPTGSAFVAIVPGARWETKIWPADHFAELIDRLQRDHGMPCVLLGSRSDLESTQRLSTLCVEPPISLVGKTTLTGLSAVLDTASCVVCHDSGPMHLASILNRPLVCLIGPTNPARTGPYRRPQDVIRLPLQCSPCYFRRLAQCPHDHRCMRDLGVQSVLEAVLRTTASDADAK